MEDEIVSRLKSGKRFEEILKGKVLPFGKIIALPLAELINAFFVVVLKNG